MATTRRTALGGFLMGLICGVALVLGLVAGPATSAVDLGKRVTKALKVAKRADKNAKKALATSRQPGPPGPSGAPGPRGPSNAHSSTSLASVPWTSLEQTLASVPVTAGSSYVVIASTSGSNTGAVALYANCRIAGPTGVTVAQANKNYLAPHNNADTAVIAMTTTLTASSSGQLTLRCISPVTDGSWLGWALTAIDVAQLN